MDKRIKIGITVGDVNGIGIEVALNALSDKRVIDNLIPIFYCSPNLIRNYASALEIKDINIKKFDPNKIEKSTIYCTTNHGENFKFDFGKATSESSKLAKDSLFAASDDLENQLIDAIVTCPINKDNIQSENFKFTGHTEYFANKFKSDEAVMIMVYNELRVALQTIHIPISKVSNEITKDKIINKLSLLDNILKKDFGIIDPKIAVLGLNPHCSDNGLIGNEEISAITPAIEISYLKNKVNSFGPFSADSFFANENYKKYDAILAMYHDQGLIGFKSLCQNKGVNVTAGLSVIRTSPDHGTAYQLAGKNVSDYESFRNSLLECVTINNNRQKFAEITKLKETKIYK